MARLPNDPSARLTRPGLLLGFALGGFFDGILLHQVLQWHHLLSGVEAAGDLRTQILADGVFHAAMYVVAATGLWSLWQRRDALPLPGAERMLWGAAAIGFGAWHLVDAAFSHWLTGIHRIRMDAGNPLAWDLGWALAFGVAPLQFGRWWRRRPGGDAGPGRGAATGTTLAIAAVLAGTLATLPARGLGDQALVLFAPGVRPAAAYDALAGAGARIAWVDRSGALWAVRFDGPTPSPLALRHDGALLVSRSALLAGCLAFASAGPTAGAADEPA